MSLRVVIADDHPLVRDGVSAMLEREGIAVVGAAGDGAAAVALACEHRPDVVVLDQSMPEVRSQWSRGGATDPGAGCQHADCVHEGPRGRTLHPRRDAGGGARMPRKARGHSRPRGSRPGCCGRWRVPGTFGRASVHRRQASVRTKRAHCSRSTDAPTVGRGQNGPGDRQGSRGQRKNRARVSVATDGEAQDRYDCGSRTVRREGTYRAACARHHYRAVLTARALSSPRRRTF